MTLTEFIEAYENHDKELLSKVIFKSYIPIRDKEKICQELISNLEDFDYHSPTSGEYIISREIELFFSAMQYYTDIIVNEKNEQIYDKCMKTGIDKFVLRKDTRGDYQRLVNMFKDMTEIKSIFLIRDTLMSFGDMDIKEDADYMMNMFKENKDTIGNLAEIFGIRAKK